MDKTNTTTATAVNPFATLMTDFAHHANTDPTAPEYVTALTDLATAVAYSVLKKCINTSYNETLTAVRSDLSRARHDLDRMAYASDHAYRTVYNTDGDEVTEVSDPSCETALAELSRSTLGDGLDLVNEAVCAILSEVEKQTARGEAVDLEAVYTARRLNRKVWIKTAESVGAWETVETSPIREVYKAVRRSIMASRAMQTDPRNGYSYLEDLSTDPESGAVETIYRRLGKCADLGGYATDFNGQATFYTVDRASVDRYDSLVASLNLSKKQATVLSLRMSGHGNKAIATYMGVTENSVKGAVNAIREKARAVGLDPTTNGEAVKRSHH